MVNKGFRPGVGNFRDAGGGGDGKKRPQSKNLKQIDDCHRGKVTASRIESLTK